MTTCKSFFFVLLFLFVAAACSTPSSQDGADAGSDAATDASADPMTDLIPQDNLPDPGGLPADATPELMQDVASAQPAQKRYPFTSGRLEPLTGRGETRREQRRVERRDVRATAGARILDWVCR